MAATSPYRLYEFIGYDRKSVLFHPIFELVPTRTEGTEYTVVIGPNGTGKSALLGAVAYAAQSSSFDSRLGASRVVAISNLVSDSFPLNRGRSVNTYHYLGLRQGTNTVTTGALTAASLAALLGLPISATPDFNWSSLADELQMEQPVIAAVHSRQPREFDRPPTSKFEESYRALDSRLAQVFDRGQFFELFGLRGSLDDRRLVLLDSTEVMQRMTPIQLEFGNQFDTSTLIRRIPYATGWRLQLAYPRKPSAGQEVLFSQVLRVVSGARERALILIDEPETALHPQWQSNFIPLLRDHVPDALGMHVILASHSPFLVGEADSVVASSEQGFTQLQADFGGLSIDAIVYQVFGASNTGSVLLERDLSLVLAFVSDGISSKLPSAQVLAASRRLRARRTESTEVLGTALDEFDRVVAERDRASQ